MTVFTPVWRLKINSVEYTDVTLASMTIESGRNNIYTQAVAGYCSLRIINTNQAAVLIDINDSLSVEIQDSTATYIPIFGGSVSEFGIEVTSSGSSAYTQTVSVTALGALSRLPKALTYGVLSQDYDGDQILSILEDLLLNNWGEVPPALTWATYTPATETWANAQNTGLGEIDTPGNYELANRTSNRTDMYSLVSALATSGLGYLYETAQGQIGYADSTHRSIYLATYGYTELSANDALSRGLKIRTKGGDVRNSVSINYGTNSASTVSVSDTDSINLYGELGQVINTTIKHVADATSQANFYLTLRATPQANFESITYALTNPEIGNADRDSLLNVFMGQPVNLSDLPLNMNSGSFQGFIEGWQFSTSYNQVSLTLYLSPIAFSLQAMDWSEVSVSELWNTLSGTLDWAHALVVN